MKNLSDEKDNFSYILAEIHGLIVVIFLLLKLKTRLDLKFISSYHMNILVYDVTIVIRI